MGNVFKQDSKNDIIQEKDYIKRAENVILGLQEKDNRGNIKEGITTTKIRSFLSMANELYNDIVLQTEKDLDSNYIKKIQHLQVKMLYDAGRDNNGKGEVKKFLDKSGLIEELKKVGNSKEKFLDFCRYFEALVAFHKYYGGK